LASAPEPERLCRYIASGDRQRMTLPQLRGTSRCAIEESLPQRYYDNRDVGAVPAAS
jgi:hypothetical protein